MKTQVIRKLKSVAAGNIFLVSTGAEHSILFFLRRVGG
jgi:hypothetical protein